MAQESPKLRRATLAVPLRRTHALRSVMRRRGILLTTYGMVQRNAGCLDHLPIELASRDEGDEPEPVWHWVFLDEVTAFLRQRAIWQAKPQWCPMLMT